MTPSYEDPELGIEVLSHFLAKTKPLGLAKKGDEPTRGLLSPSYENPELSVKPSMVATPTWVSELLIPLA